MERIILDTDIATDVDDAMALALAMKSPEIKLEAVTTVYGDVKLRARLAKKLLQFGGCEEVPVYAGIELPLLHNREVWWPGHEGKGVLHDDEAIVIRQGFLEFLGRQRLANIDLKPGLGLQNLHARTGQIVCDHHAKSHRDCSLGKPQ